MGIPLDKAEFLALFLETVVYGVFLTLCIITLIVLAYFRQSENRRDGYLRLIAGIMLLLATSHLILDFVRAVHAFVIDREVLEPVGPTAYYASLNAPLFLAKTVLYWTQTMVGDGVIVWRCYIVHSRRVLFVVFPIILMLGVFVSGVQVVNSLAHATLGSDIFTTAENWITTYFVLTMTINLYCSGAIAWRIYRSGSMIEQRTTSMLPVLVVVVESGALYTSGVVAFLCAYLSGSNGQYPALDVITPLVGIGFCLIIIQVRFHFGMRSSMQTGQSSAATDRRRTHFWSSAPGTGTQASGAHGIPMSPLTIEVTTHIEEDEGLAADSKAKEFDGAQIV